MTEVVKEKEIYDITRIRTQLMCCQLPILVITNRHHMSFRNDDELWDAVKGDKALANTKVVYFTIETGCLNIRIF